MTEAVSMKGCPCPICLEDFDDGEKVIFFSCGGNHHVCSICYAKYLAEDAAHIAATYANTMYEAVRRNECADKCPVCRGMSHCATIAIAENFYTGTAKDPVVVE